MRLLDGTGATDHRRHAERLEDPGLGAKGDDLGPIRPCQFHEDVAGYILIGGDQAVDFAGDLGDDIGAGHHGPHRRQKVVGAIGLQIGLHEVGVPRVDGPHPPVHPRLAGDHVMRDAARQRAGVDRRPRRVEAAAGRRAGLQPFLEAKKAGNIAHRVFDRVHAPVGA